MYSPVTQFLQEESSNTQVLYKEKSYHHQVVGPPWSGRFLVLGVRALGEEMTELMQLPTLGSQRAAFTFTISFDLHINNGLDIVRPILQRVKRKVRKFQDLPSGFTSCGHFYLDFLLHHHVSTYGGREAEEAEA